METIQNLMIEEHRKLFQVLNSFKKKRTSNSLKVMNKKHKDHIIAEEKEIFPLQKRKTKLLKELIDQHRKIEKILENIEKKFNSKEDYSKEIEKLNKLLILHFRLEDRDYFPKLEEKISKKEEKTALKEVHKIIK